MAHARYGVKLTDLLISHARRTHFQFLILIAPLRSTVTVAEALRFAPMTFHFLSDIALSILWSAKMAPHPGIDTDHIREKARKDLLDLLEGVCKAQQYILQVQGRC